MSYYDKLKKDLYEERNRVGLRNKVCVDTQSLIKLLEDYGKMDAYLRSKSDDTHLILQIKLSNILRALYYENHDSERLMLLIMDILNPMIIQRVKENEINSQYIRN